MDSIGGHSELFQFLIGSLQTVQPVGRLYQYWQFQFLIGSLQTTDQDSQTRELCRFQFLIGSLQTPFRSQKEQQPADSFNSL